jgi:hypothetical protein
MKVRQRDMEGRQGVERVGGNCREKEMEGVRKGWQEMQRRVK